jgi:putative membrane protein insertion efficiency factor
MDLIPTLTSTLFLDRCPATFTKSWNIISLLRLLKKAVNFLFRTSGLLAISVYRSIGTAWLGGACRFEPSCSEYAAEAFREFEPYQALTFSLRRICRCRPGGGCGYDPLPYRGHHERSK